MNVDQIFTPMNVILLIIVVIAIILWNFYRKRVLKEIIYREEDISLPKEIETCKEIPFEGDFWLIFSVMHKFISDNNFITAIILKWIQDGIVEINTRS